MPLTMTTPTELTIEVRRFFAAPRALIWRAYTDPGLVPRWLTGPEGHTMPICEMDVRVGGAFRWVWEFPDGNRMEATGTYSVVETERRLVNSEGFDFAPGSSTHVETLLEDAPGGTNLIQTMTYDSQATRDAVLKTPMDQGMEASFARLDGMLGSLHNATDDAASCDNAD
ncbi:MAG: SRPBCC domain-containing protein [Pseudomonadota bacterium]